MTVEEMNTQLQMQVNALNASLNSLQQSFDAQTALITQLNQTIQELREQLNKNSKNSSKPPSSDGFKKPAPKSLRKPSGKKVGGQESHQGTYLSVISDPDEIVKHMPSACEGCPHYKMCKGTACVAEKRHVIDAVVTVNVVEHQLLEIPICMLHGDTRKGSFPNDVKATVQYGENLQALSVALNTVGAVSVKRTHEILSGVFNISLATGIISNMVKRCADAVSETVNRIKQKVADSSLGHFDETGTRVDKKLWWVHDASNCEFTYLDISPKRGYLGMEQCGVLPLFHGISMHDCWASYWSYEDCQHAVCCAHLLRELTGIAENHPEQKWVSAFIGLLIKMKKVKDKAVEAGKETLSYYHYHKFDKRYDELIKQAREKIRFRLPQRKNVGERKKERFLLWWSALIITRHQSAFLSITSCFRLITIRRNEI